MMMENIASRINPNPNPNHWIFNWLTNYDLRLIKYDHLSENDDDDSIASLINPNTNPQLSFKTQDSQVTNSKVKSYNIYFI